jgi:hypothetical protein
MRNKDTILLENAYMTIHETYREIMPRFSKIPSVEKSTNNPSYKEDVTERNAKSALKINKNIEELEKDPNNIAAAIDTLNIINNFDKEREHFWVKGEESTYEDVLRLLLKLTTTSDNDPALIIKNDDPNSADGLKIDDYLKEWDPKLRRKVAIPGRSAAHYFLFRELIDALPDMDAVTRSRREEGKDGVKRHDIFYWAKRHDVYSTEDGAHIGYFNPGSGFYPNETGEERGIPSMKARPWNAYVKANKAKLGTPILIPLRNNIYVSKDGTVDEMFFEKNSRTPRYVEIDNSQASEGSSKKIYKGQTHYAPAPNPFDKYRPEQIRGSTLKEIELAVDSKNAEKEFRKRWPQDQYPQLYKGGNTPGLIIGKDPTEI